MTDMQSISLTLAVLAVAFAVLWLRWNVPYYLSAIVGFSACLIGALVAAALS